MAKRKPHKIQPPPPAPWCFDPGHEGARQIFCAALTGVLANPRMVDHTESPTAAVEFAVSFAHEVVREFQKRSTEEAQRESVKLQTQERKL